MVSRFDDVCTQQGYCKHGCVPLSSEKYYGKIVEDIMTNTKKLEGSDWLAEQLFWEPKRYQVEFCRQEKEATWNLVTKRLQCSSRLTASSDSMNARSQFMNMRKGIRVTTKATMDVEKGLDNDNVNQSGAFDQRLCAIGTN
jgi:hypothetical protein